MQLVLLQPGVDRTACLSLTAFDWDAVIPTSSVESFISDRRKLKFLIRGRQTKLMVCRLEFREVLPSAEDPQRWFPLRSIVSIIGVPPYCFAKHLADLLGSYTHNSPHIKRSAGYVRTLGSLRAATQDVVVSFDVETLYTRVPVMEAMSLLNRYFEEHILKLFLHVVTSSSFSCTGQSYGCSHGLVTRRSPQPIVNSLLAVLQRVDAGQFRAVRFANTSLVDQPK
jgi:hypothetical protein